MDALLIAVAFFFGLLAKQFGLPPLVGFLISGFVLHALEQHGGETLDTISNLGITLMLFTIGLKLRLRGLLRPEIWAGDQHAHRRDRRHLRLDLSEPLRARCVPFWITHDVDVVAAGACLELFEHRFRLHPSERSNVFFIPCGLGVSLSPCARSPLSANLRLSPGAADPSLSAGRLGFYCQGEC
jgi:Sodium/hydrogen exchanger family